MYLKKIVIRNIGAIEKLDISMPFEEKGDPKPLIIVGENGTGKSILLSHIADAMLEFQNSTFKQDEVLKRNSNGYSFFKTLGGGNTTLGKSNSIAYLQFENNNKKYEYLETTGEVTDSELKDNISECKLSINKANNKQITNLVNEELESTFLHNSYCYFPPNRFEMPHWINKVYDSGKNKITHKQRYSGKLDKTFIIESCQDEIAQWILDVFLDASVIAKHREGINYDIQNNDVATRSQLVKSKENIEQILTKILKRDAELDLNYRNHPLSRIKVIDGTNKQEIIPSLNNLSTGQSVLFNLFCSIIKHGEKDEANIKYNDIIEGIAIIDEVDLHLHSDLQTDVLPELIELFPKIQFIITTHSPLFLLGMEKKFGTNDIEIREMPTGDVITAERFREFDKAYDYFKKTKKSEEDLQKIMQAQDDKPVLFVEGKTDKIILENAWRKLYPNSQIPFCIQDAFDMHFIANTFKRGDIFLKSNKTFIGMLDFDDAYEKYIEIKNTNKGNNYSDYEANTNKGLCLKHVSQNGFVFLLPIPTNRINLASVKWGKDSEVCIEYLFSDDKIINLLEDKEQVGGNTIKIITKDYNKKSKFASDTANFQSSDFENFKAIFELIDKIIKNN
jgi:predicted ATP-binding protein involved in virulence